MYTPQIPLCDNLLQIAMPETPLTKILEDFRQYRPGNHREFLEWVKVSAGTVGIKDFALTDPQSAGMYSHFDKLRWFRWLMKYISNSIVSPLP